jgi:hypothetical protein
MANKDNHEQFVQFIINKLETMSGSQIVAIPDIWESLSEEFNNDWCDYADNHAYTVRKPYEREPFKDWGFETLQDAEDWCGSQASHLWVIIHPDGGETDFNYALWEEYGTSEVPDDFYEYEETDADDDAI